MLGEPLAVAAPESEGGSGKGVTRVFRFCLKQETWPRRWDCFGNQWQVLFKQQQPSDESGFAAAKGGKGMPGSEGREHRT